MVKLNVKLLKDKIEFQSIYEAWIDFDATIKNLLKLGYTYRRYSAGRPKDGIQLEDAGNLVFTLKSGATINVSPKGQPHKIQVTWNIYEDKEKQSVELKNVFVSLKRGWIALIPCHSISFSYTDNRDEFLDKLSNEGLI